MQTEDFDELSNPTEGVNETLLFIHSEMETNREKCPMFDRETTKSNEEINDITKEISKLRSYPFLECVSLATRISFKDYFVTSISPIP
ncbi:hypothetical protein Mapa_006427 [Marchantia paleacea]|nr:hypothetical protein Mapa_006427 [Marchantia paleacea]